MSESMLKMWISIAGMGLLAVAMIAIYFSRYKIKMKLLKAITALFAYLCLIVGGIIMVFVVFTGPTGN
ncbi:DUF2768 domain-containing protein [Heyndrickxia sporothermodurans]|uniref:DUF2768 domain-containing protein n=2 Tax=Heyndrickxia sporothermodurans TaxID=46224 RepID=A0A150LAD5_9BACI|nr:DUF2768 domain-containing protein [Heyndrickxia sporothermodurans]KYD09277.1 hypothetical protein B4102_2543 [Heyndrickxia sporothermodurans]MBL5767328.1 DUF2768 domain-containing protein [Heyndrickxia sporothermodurans]MBL5770243.1 DUF2768 domain-containing protein [Heyndrickxia sporothermodurans]MBL5774093.1 DUF2768 domain-containing protein [Heyndrickxia sporothermodurans]MBL5777432.1 DUF2768 domain-containing protein [Heyndrickxia sporothermodurans]